MKRLLEKTQDMEILYQTHHAEWQQFIQTNHQEFSSQLTFELLEGIMAIVMRTEWTNRKRCLEMFRGAPKPPYELPQAITLMLSIPDGENDFEYIDFDAPICLRLVLVCESFREFKRLPIFHSSLIIFNGIMRFALLTKVIKATRDCLEEFACVFDKDHSLYTVRCRPSGYGASIANIKIPISIVEQSIEDKSFFYKFDGYRYWTTLNYLAKQAKKDDLL